MTDNNEELAQLVDAWGEVNATQGRNSQSDDMARAATAIRAQAAEIAALQAKVDALMPFAMFGKEMLTDWHQYGDIEGFDRFKIGRKCGVIIPIQGGFDPERHDDEYGQAEVGDDWYQTRDFPAAITPEGSRA